MYGTLIHNAWVAAALLDVGNDPENEVLISVAGDQWIAGLDPEMGATTFP